LDGLLKIIRIKFYKDTLEKLLHSDYLRAVQSKCNTRGVCMTAKQYLTVGHLRYFKGGQSLARFSEDN